MACITWPSRDWRLLKRIASFRCRRRTGRRWIRRSPAHHVHQAFRSVKYARRVCAATLDKKRRGQAPERVVIEPGDAELGARQPRHGRGGRRRRRDGDDAELAGAVDVRRDGPVATCWGGSWSISPGLRGART